jgi:hypothetical protein
MDDMEKSKYKYRVVRDTYAGYKAQCKSNWWPFWRMVGFLNTSCSINQSIAICNDHKVKMAKSKDVVWESDKL